MYPSCGSDRGGGDTRLSPELLGAGAGPVLCADHGAGCTADEAAHVVDRGGCHRAEWQW